MSEMQLCNTKGRMEMAANSPLQAHKFRRSYFAVLIAASECLVDPRLLLLLGQLVQQPPLLAAYSLFAPEQAKQTDVETMAGCIINAEEPTAMHWSYTSEQCYAL